MSGEVKGGDITMPSRPRRSRRRSAAAAARLSSRLVAALAELEPCERSRVVAEHRARLAEQDLARFDPALLARIGAGWVAGVEDLSARDAAAAAELRDRMLRWLGADASSQAGGR